MHRERTFELHQFMRTTFRSLALILLAGCADVTAPGNDTPTELTLRRAPTSISVGDKILVLRTHLWRDFMPIAPPDGQPMVGIFGVETDDQSPFPAGVSIERAWVLKGSLAWAPNLINDPLYDPAPSQRAKVGRNGPKWGPAISVEVIVEIELPDGRRRLLRQPNVLIQRSD